MTSEPLRARNLDDSFRGTLARHGTPLERTRLSTLQVNLGLLCNQACHHCHVDAGPQRSEVMSAATIDRLLALLEAPSGAGVGLVDLTGGAPELNPGFRRLVAGCRALGKRVIDRCNLTVLRSVGGDLAGFLAEHRVEVVASLPCYTAETVDAQRGRGVFEESIETLRELNALGYGRAGSDLVLRLVYNPAGPSLPPPQCALEAAYRERLQEDHGVVFDELLTLTNMPIRRFRDCLERRGQLEGYEQLLRESFNPATLPALMCRSLLSVSWDGRLFDCDFNQMEELPVPRRRRTIWEVESLADFDRGEVAVGEHCFGCTAGAGSSCQGALQ